MFIQRHSTDLPMRPRIMIVEDNQAIARAMQYLLAREGYETKWCEDETVYSIVREWKPDLILMDLKMPHLDGGQATATIKSDPDMNEIPVIVITADKVNEERFAQIRANELINKPFQVRHLLESIRHWLTGEKFKSGTSHRTMAAPATAAPSLGASSQPGGEPQDGARAWQ